MTETLLIRARLKRHPSIASIASLLLPNEASARAGASHRLVWSLFAADPDQKRDFLWREDKEKTFYILSPQAPCTSEIFDVDMKPFAPDLAPGDFLQFSLRANATRAVKPPGSRGRGKRADIVMAHLPNPNERAPARARIIVDAGTAWLKAQGEKHGFSLPAQPRVDGYETLKIPRPGGPNIRISTLDFDGILQVTDPALFNAALLRGFGHARAFGCGLMLIRRAG
jgi:CRISPR system Cascade subunit CasE